MVRHDLTPLLTHKEAEMDRNGCLERSPATLRNTSGSGTLTPEPRTVSPPQVLRRYQTASQDLRIVSPLLEEVRWLGGLVGQEAERKVNICPNGQRNLLEIFGDASCPIYIWLFCGGPPRFGSQEDAADFSTDPIQQLLPPASQLAVFAGLPLCAGRAEDEQQLGPHVKWNLSEAIDIAT